MAGTAMTNGIEISRNTEVLSVENSTPTSDDAVGHYKVYKTRWLILAIVCVLNLSNAMVIISLPFCTFLLTHSHTVTPFDAPGKQAF